VTGDEDDDLPEVRDQLARDEDPEDLPRVQSAPVANNLDQFRVCRKCGVEGRVVSNDLGVNVYCQQCKDFWPVSGCRAPDKRMPLSAPRGLSKQSRAEPDVSVAFEQDEEP
jgi:hypothetical protein